jgi:Tol biopolymer transport system component
MSNLTRTSRRLSMLLLVILSLFALNMESFVVSVQAKNLNGPMSPVWSPDGKQIVMSMVQNETSWSLNVLDVTTGKMTKLTDDGTSPAWSPDG